ncbi:MAG: hypothetical protein AAF744_10940 [Pseudomonadota bacterium]
MTRIYAKHIATITELREPHKVFERSGGKPVAIMKNSKCVGYLVPAEATPLEEPRYATREEVLAAIEARREVNQPVLDYLKDK